MAAIQPLATLLFGISRLDPLTYVGLVGLLLAVSAIACWLPASERRKSIRRSRYEQSVLSRRTCFIRPQSLR